MRHSEVVTIKGGAQVSQLGLGTAQLGGLFESLAQKDVDDLLEFAIQEKITYFDTAPHYGKGVAERRLGSHLARYPRDSWVISTKVGRLLVSAQGTFDEEFADSDAGVERRFDYSEKGVRQCFEESLQRLGVDCLDIVYIHDPDDYADVAIGETFPVLAQLKAEGLIKSIGVGMNETEIPIRFIKETDIDVVMIAGKYTLLDYSALDELLPVALDRGVSIIAAGVFNSGVLANPKLGSHYFYEPAPESVIARAQYIEKELSNFGVTLKQAALQFPMRHPAVKAVVVGCRSAASLQENIKNFDKPIPDNAWHKISELHSESMEMSKLK